MAAANPSAKELVASLNKQYQARDQVRPVAWEAGLRRWRVLRHVKLYRAAMRTGDKDMAQHHLTQYGKAVDQVERMMKLDPLHTGEKKGGAQAGEELQFKEGSGKEFKWQDQDYVAGEEAFVPQLDVAVLQTGEVLATSGDRRKQAVEARQLASQRAAEARRAKRQREVDDITNAAAGPADADSTKPPAVQHNWDSYQSALERQKEEVKRQATRVSNIASAADNFADVLGDSDDD
eukprot:TRINITY_DN22023_c0_g1_i1.p2 TRINITY_DN22023_c0_g1~~TRINITY_DN22023_c0_g1_i1.p2  ORF type:complete len:235 (+),score=92.93 TRINITY_DN22023_c0_g1_i1:63-767(+)